MERIFLVKNGNLDEVNRWLQKGGRVKAITPIAEPIVAYGYAGGRSDNSSAASPLRKGWVRRTFLSKIFLELFSKLWYN